MTMSVGMNSVQFGKLTVKEKRVSKEVGLAALRDVRSSMGLQGIYHTQDITPEERAMMDAKSKAYLQGLRALRRERKDLIQRLEDAGVDIVIKASHTIPHPGREENEGQDPHEVQAELLKKAGVTYDEWRALNHDPEVNGVRLGDEVIHGLDVALVDRKTRALLKEPSVRLYPVRPDQAVPAAEVLDNIEEKLEFQDGRVVTEPKLNAVMHERGGTVWLSVARVNERGETFYQDLIPGKSLPEGVRIGNLKLSELLEMSPEARKAMGLDVQA